MSSEAGVTDVCAALALFALVATSWPALAAVPGVPVAAGGGGGGIISEYASLGAADDAATTAADVCGGLLIVVQVVERRPGRPRLPPGTLWHTWCHLPDLITPMRLAPVTVTEGT